MLNLVLGQFTSAQVAIFQAGPQNCSLQLPSFLPQPGRPSAPEAGPSPRWHLHKHPVLGASERARWEFLWPLQVNTHLHGLWWRGDRLVAFFFCVRTALMWLCRTYSGGSSYTPTSRSVCKVWIKSATPNHQTLTLAYQQLAFVSLKTACGLLRSLPICCILWGVGRGGGGGGGRGEVQSGPVSATKDGLERRQCQMAVHSAPTSGARLPDQCAERAQHSNCSSGFHFFVFIVYEVVALGTRPWWCD